MIGLRRTGHSWWHSKRSPHQIVSAQCKWPPRVRPAVSRVQRRLLAHLAAEDRDTFMQPLLDMVKVENERATGGRKTNERPAWAPCRPSQLWRRDCAVCESGVPVHFLSNVCFVRSVEDKFLTQWARPNEQWSFILRNEGFKSEGPLLHSCAQKPTFWFRPASEARVNLRRGTSPFAERRSSLRQMGSLAWPEYHDAAAHHMPERRGYAIACDLALRLIGGRPGSQ